MYRRSLVAPWGDSARGEYAPDERSADLGALLDFHEQNDAEVTLHLVRVADPRAFGCVPTDESGRVTAFLEKTEDPPTDQINAGCYVFDRAIIDGIPRGREVSVEREVFPGLLSSGVKMCGYVDATYWRDMGTPDDFVRGSSDLVRGIAPSPALGGRRGESLVHDGASVAPGAVLIGGTVVGRGAEIGPGVRLDGAVVFDGARVEAGSVIERSIVGAGARIGPRALIRDGVIGDGANIGARCELLRGARVWPGVVLPDCGIRYSRAPPAPLPPRVCVYVQEVRVAVCVDAGWGAVAAVFQPLPAPPTPLPPRVCVCAQEVRVAVCVDAGWGAVSAALAAESPAARMSAATRTPRRVGRRPPCGHRR